MASEAKLNIIVRLFLEKGDKVLLLKQTSRNGGSYTMIGGKIDSDEMAVTALIRESFEETGIVLKEKRLKLVHVTNRARKITKNELILIFRARKWAGSPESKEPKKFDKVAWVDIQSLPKSTLPLVKHIFKEYQKGRFYSEYFDPV